MRETADCWNDNIERWVYATRNDLAQQIGVEGYYVRIAPPQTACAPSPLEGFVPIKNRPPEYSFQAATHVVSPDALALVRFGLRAPDDPRILNTVKVIDALLRVTVPQGPCWYRYNGDGYGEHEDGSPFDGTGTGRPWPLLAGERGHYELAAGKPRKAEELLRVMEFSTEGGRLIPEQVWDQPDIPARELLFGKPTGSACPLVWAHSEYIKLRRSVRDGKIFDQPPQTRQRYLVENKKAEFFEWRFNNKCRSMPPGKNLRLTLLQPALVHWSFDHWQSSQDTPTADTGLGIYVADLPANSLRSAAEIVFTLFWLRDQRWEGEDYSVAVENA
jgi:glucoamylase